MHGEALLDESGRLFSIGDVKTCSLIIINWRYHLRFPQDSFSMKMRIVVVCTCQIGVNRDSVGTQDTLASSQKESIAIRCIHSPSFVLYDIMKIHPWHHASVKSSPDP